MNLLRRLTQSRTSEIDNVGDFRLQRARVVSKTSQKAGWVLRTFLSRDIPTLRTLWKATVQPHCDYASQLWHPALVASHILELEAPLWALTRRMNGIQRLDYWERLSRSGLQSIERRAEHYKVFYMWI